ncbi:MAG: hypothetical protein K5866_06430 [Treponema sp.]|nr:hypothetical protein [Treponema sp.]
MKKSSLFIGLLVMCCFSNLFAKPKKINVTIDLSAPTKSISPYIFGVNDGVDLKKLQAGSIRLGGNRMTAYNWESNKSNAGSDWYNNSDNYLINRIRSQFKRTPAGPALNVIEDARQFNVPYTLLTLQMAGYVANKDGKMTADNSLDGEDWCKIINHKEGEFLLKPDKRDHFVYTDEYLNYLENIVGNSQNGGFKGYALDNEPALWEHTHSLIQKERISAEELIKKSIDLAATVKEFDPKADVFGPALFGYSAYDSLGWDWNLIKAKNAYRHDWFIDYYLDEMNKASQEKNIRLLDVLDLHYYTEAKGECGKRKCDHYDNDGCIKARINAVRSLYDPEYKENSWIVDIGARHFPLLPKLTASIEKFYPGTKIAFTEYDFGGGEDISGAIAQTDFLGILAEYEVYFASIWSFDKNQYQLAAINLFTNYDGKGSSFGQNLLSAKSEDDYVLSSYAATSNDDNKLRIILCNKEIHDETKVTIKLENGNYKKASCYVLDKSSANIYPQEKSISVNKDTLTVKMQPLSIYELVLE